MPPVRSTMTAAKPIKTERTHEENQERAYIAASRRSDRSLEARVESARRASEIHKRRTGRSLKVTEQDVVNEEMYEEEDDDLPMQYRRLTAHLQTTNADFDRRLAAYLTNHVAMRTALGQAVSDSYAHQQYPNAAQFANPMQQQFPQNALMSPSPMLPPQNPSRSPQMYRQSPYPMSNPQQGYRPSAHSRAASIATPQELHGFSHNFSTSNHSSPVENIKMEDRRMSLPATGMVTPGVQSVASPPRLSPTASRTSSSSNLANLKLEAAQQGFFKQGAQHTSPIKQEQGQGHNAFQAPAQQLRPSTFPSPFDMSGGFDPTGMNMAFGGPFSTSLPPESQQLLAGAFDPNDPMTSMLMGGDSRSQQPFYSYNPNGMGKKSFNAPSAFDGMNQTLAPGVLDTNAPAMSGFGDAQSGATDSPMSAAYGSGLSFGFDSRYSDAFKPNDFMNSGATSGEVTPNEDRDWQNLIDGNAWEEQSSQTTAT